MLGLMFNEKKVSQKGDNFLENKIMQQSSLPLHSSKLDSSLQKLSFHSLGISGHCTGFQRKEYSNPPPNLKNLSAVCPHKCP